MACIGNRTCRPYPRHTGVCESSARVRRGSSFVISQWASFVGQAGERRSHAVTYTGGVVMMQRQHGWRPNCGNGVVDRVSCLITVGSLGRAANMRRRVAPPAVMASCRAVKIVTTATETMGMLAQASVKRTAAVTALCAAIYSRVKMRLRGVRRWATMTRRTVARADCSGCGDGAGCL